jgi:enamine deaminase RidA (YjgF/YER057c/UK114 family)
MTARGTTLAIAGMVGWDAEEKIVSPEFVPQFRRALMNVREVVEAAGGTPADLISLTLYVTDKQDYLGRVGEVGAVYREVMGKHFPAMALVEVAGLLETSARVEIQGLAVLPDA